MEKPDSEVIDAYLGAWEYRPNRLEALYHLIKFLGVKKRYALAFALSSIGMKTGPCSDILFVEDDIWKWRMPDEYSVLAFYNGNAKEAYNTTAVIMNSPIFNALPQMERDRIAKNMEFYSKSLTPEPQNVEEAVES